MDVILVLNAGSSSIKFALFDAGRSKHSPHGAPLCARGRIALRGSQIELVVTDPSGTALESSRSAAEHGSFDQDVALARLFAWLAAHGGGSTLVAVGHRVVHGGRQYTAPVRVTPVVLAELEALIALAPLHQPYNLHAIRMLSQTQPTVPQFACFDTAFHATQPALAQAYALPVAITAGGVRRYGFHGLSYEYIAAQLPRMLGNRAEGRVIVAHLGNGASLCALVKCASVASTMGFSTLDGLMMGTRCGALDAAVVLHLLQQRGMTVSQVSDLLYRESGLLGVSGISSDMQVLLASDAPAAAAAIALFVYRIICEIGALSAAMGGLDALVFSGGIGEHAAPIRARIMDGCAWLGARYDIDANLRAHTRVDSAASTVMLAIVPTDEETVIAQHVVRCIADQNGSASEVSCR